jgi:hypothetical protein
MSTNIQKKVMDHLEKIATDCDLDFVEQPQFSNTGMVYLQRGFYTVISFSYHFSDSKVELQWYPAGVETKRSVGFADSRCILNIYSGIIDLTSAMEKCENLIHASSPPKNIVDRSEKVSETTQDNEIKSGILQSPQIKNDCNSCSTCSFKCKT